MGKLLSKEFKLVTHPTTFIFMLLSSMMLIPNYPYYVTFFYTTLGVYFCCLTARENHDIYYTLNLPVRKKDIVSARFAFVISIELLQVIIAIPFALLRQSFDMPGNQVGMDANIALFGLSFIMLGIFNILFLTKYYKNPLKIGGAFVIGSIVSFVYMAVMEVLTHIVPFFRDKLDTPDSQFLTEKLAVLGAGIVIYAALTGIALARSRKSFETLDM